MSDCPGALAKLVLRKLHTKTSLMKLKFSARKAVHNCYHCWKFELKIFSDSGDMHFSAIKPRWGGCPPLKIARNEVKNASFAQRSAHRDSRIWRPELIKPATKRKRRAQPFTSTEIGLSIPNHTFFNSAIFHPNTPVMFGFSESADIRLSF